MGTYPEVSLKAARLKRDEARELLAKKVDPGLARKLEKAGNKENTFQAVAEEFLVSNAHRWSDSLNCILNNVMNAIFSPRLGRGSLEVAARMI